MYVYVYTHINIYVMRMRRQVGAQSPYRTKIIPTEIS